MGEGGEPRDRASKERGVAVSTEAAWLNSIGDKAAQARVRVRLRRLEGSPHPFRITPLKLKSCVPTVGSPSNISRSLVSLALAIWKSDTQDSPCSAQHGGHALVHRESRIKVRALPSVGHEPREASP